MQAKTNRFEGIEGSHFQRLRVAFLELVRLARHGDAINPKEVETLEQIAIAFVTREIEMRAELARTSLETLELANEQLVELTEQEVKLIAGALEFSAAESPSLRDQFQDPKPRVFLKFETPQERAKRQAAQVRSALLADQIRPGPWIPVEGIPPMAKESAVQLVEQARIELSEALARLRQDWAGGNDPPVAEEQAQLVALITRASYLWSALRFTT